MKSIHLFFAAVLAFVSIDAAAQQGVGQVITEPPKASLGVTRDSYQDSTMQGGVGFGFPGPVVIPPPPPPPDPCVTDPSAAGCGGSPTYCESNPSDPACTSSPPPPPPPPTDPCIADPTSPECDGGGGGSGGRPPADPAMMAGCHVDTDAFDQFQAGGCSGTGVTSTDEVAFSVGDRVNATNEYAEFTDPSAYAVQWSGACAMPKTTGASACVVTQSTPTWAERTLTASATIYRVSDNAVIGTFSIEAFKQTCNRMNYLPGSCPMMP